MENYKVECIASTGLPYLAHPFEVFFDKEEAMFDFMDIVPDSYTTKHYQRNNRNSKWTLIAEIEGWRKDCCNE
jgi:hypothetical protein